MRETRQYTGAVDCLKQLYRAGGVRSLYKGTLATSLRFGPPCGVFFVTYEFLLDAMTAPGEKRDSFSPFRISLAGGAAGILLACGYSSRHTQISTTNMSLKEFTPVFYLYIETWLEERDIKPCLKVSCQF